MRKLLLLLLLPALAFGGISFVQKHDTTSNTSGNSLNLKYASDNTAHNLLICIIEGYSTNAQHSISDSLGNTWALIDSFWYSAASCKITAYYAKNCLGGGNRVTASYSANETYRRMAVLEYAGADTSAPLDAEKLFYGAVPAAGTDVIVTGKLKPSRRGDLAFSTWEECNGASNTGASAGTGFTLRFMTSASYHLMGEDSINNSLDSIQATWTITTGGTGNYNGVYALFKPLNSGSFSLTDFSNYQVFQRIGSDGYPGGTQCSVTVAGICKSSTGYIKAKVVSLADSIIVDWITISTLPDSGNFSKKILVPTGGWYKLKICDDLGDTVTGSNKWGVGDIWLVAGQSLIMGWNGTHSVTRDTSSDSAVNFSRLTWQRMIDPMLTGRGASPFVKIGKILVAKTGVPQAFINTAQGGTKLNGDWNDRHVPLTDTSYTYNRSYQYAVYAGGKVRGLIWGQGESDAVAGTSKSLYKTLFDTLMNRYRNDLGLPLMPVFYDQCGRLPLGSATKNNLAAIKNAQVELEDTSKHYYLVTALLDLPLISDSIHLTMAGNDTLGVRFGNKISKWFDGNWLKYPTIKSVESITRSICKINTSGYKLQDIDTISNLVITNATGDTIENKLLHYSDSTIYDTLNSVNSTNKYILRYCDSYWPSYADAFIYDSAGYPLPNVYDSLVGYIFDLCTLTIAAGSGGTASPSGAQSDTCGDTLQIIAAPNTGYQFVNWTRSGTTATIIDSLNDTTNVFRTDSATGTVTITANFAAIYSICTLTIAAGSGGTVSPSGAQSDTCGDSLQIIATPNTGYMFTKWTRSGTTAKFLDSLNDTTKVFRTDSAAGTVTVTANFEDIGNRDTIIASSKWNVAGTWADGTPPGVNDTVYKINNGTFNDTLDTNRIIKAFICDAATAGTHWRNGRTLTVTGDGTAYSDDGTGTRDLGTGLTASGASATVHFGSTLGAVTANTTTLTFTGTTGATLDDDKGLNGSLSSIKALVLGNSAKLTVSGGASVIGFNNAGTILTLGTSAELTLTQNAQFLATANNNLWSIGLGAVWKGAGNVTIRNAANSITTTLPALTYTGTGLWTIENGNSITGSSFSLAGNLNVGAASTIQWFNDKVNTSLTVNLNTYNFTCNSFRPGATAVSATYTLNSGTSGLVTCNTYLVHNAVYTTGACNINLQAKQHNVSGNITFGANCTVSEGTSLFTADSTGTNTHNGKRFYDLTVSGARTFADACTTSGDLLVTGTAELKSSGVAICSFGDFYCTNSDSVYLGYVKVAAVGSFGSGCIPKFTTDSLVFDSLYFAPVNSDSLRGVIVVRKAVFAAGAKVIAKTGSKIICSTCNGVTNLSSGTLPPITYSITADTTNCNGPLVLRAIDSLYVAAGSKLIVSDSVTYDASCKVNAGTGSRILSVPGDTLRIRMNGKTGTPPIIKRNSRIIWR